MLKQLCCFVTILLTFFTCTGELQAEGSYSMPAGIMRVRLKASAQKPLALPFYPFDGDLNNLFHKQLTGAAVKNRSDLVYIWDNASQRYKSFFKAENTGDDTKNGKFFEDDISWSVAGIKLAPGTGFIVQNNQIFDQNLFLFGRVILDDSKSITLSPGINLIGYPFTSNLYLNSSKIGRASCRERV